MRRQKNAQSPVPGFRSPIPLLGEESMSVDTALALQKTDILPTRAPRSLFR